MSLTLYFLRHGETESSLNDVFCGTLDPDLTPQGKEMAKAFADAYKSFDWSAIYVSPMKRTIATAKPFCDATGMEMQIKDGLKEMNFGQWENRTRIDMLAASVSVIQFGLHGPLLKKLGDRSYMSQGLQDRAGT